jgi:predicted Zn-ribbon and HTH transcriptional regulator
MKLNCKRCGSKIVPLNFQEEFKLEIRAMINQNRQLLAVKKIGDELKLSHKEAKVIVAHLNKKFGRCHRCNFQNLMKENVECPKCKSFNYNLKID